MKTFRPVALTLVACLSLASCRTIGTQGESQLTSEAPPTPSKRAVVMSIGGDLPARATTPPNVSTSYPSEIALVSYGSQDVEQPYVEQQPIVEQPMVEGPRVYGHACPGCGPGEYFGNGSYEDSDGWRPPGISGLWPQDEYICDGGDRELKVLVDRDWTVRGLDTQDTIVHFDTLSGKTIVEESNRVCLYAPRFAAVRQITRAVSEESRERAIGLDAPLAANGQDLTEGPNAVTQPLQIERNLALTAPYGFLERNRALGVENVRQLLGFDFDLLPFEDLGIIRDGQYDASEKARLAELINAAKTWETYEGVQVLISGQAATEVVNDQAAQEVVVYEMPKGKPRLRICKIASKQNALPGDVVEFTLRYDNIGNETIGNVTIIDSLTTRLEYIPDTARSTRDADFFSTDNEGDSLILRWELKQPLKVGEGGIIRFNTRVR